MGNPSDGSQHPWVPPTHGCPLTAGVVAVSVDGHPWDPPLWTTPTTGPSTHGCHPYPHPWVPPTLVLPLTAGVVAVGVGEHHQLLLHPWDPHLWGPPPKGPSTLGCLPPLGARSPQGLLLVHTTYGCRHHQWAPSQPSDPSDRTQHPWVPQPPMDDPSDGSQHPWVPPTHGCRLTAGVVAVGVGEHQQWSPRPPPMGAPSDGSQHQWVPPVPPHLGAPHPWAPSHRGCCCCWCR